MRKTGTSEAEHDLPHSGIPYHPKALIEDSDRSRAWLGKFSHAYSSLKESYARHACYFAEGSSY